MHDFYQDKSVSDKVDECNKENNICYKFTRQMLPGDNYLAGNIF